MTKEQWCKLTTKGIKTFGGQKAGIILGESRDKKCFSIKWYGRKNSTTYHKSFIIKVNSKEAETIMSVQDNEHIDNFDKWFELLWQANYGDFRSYKAKQYLKNKIIELLINKKLLKF